MQAATLYWNIISQPSRSLAVFFDLAKVDVEKKHLEFTKGDHKTPEFMKINPRGQLPAYSEGDFHLAESATIMRYIMATRDAPESLYPKDTKTRAQVDTWCDWALGTLRPMNYLIFDEYKKIMFKTGEFREENHVLGVKRLKQHLTYLDE